MKKPDASSAFQVELQSDVRETTFPIATRNQAIESMYLSDGHYVSSVGSVTIAGHNQVCTLHDEIAST